MSQPRVLCFDIESAGTNALKSDLGFVIVFGWKFSDEKKAHSLILTQKELHKFDDRRLLIEASKLFAQADVVVAHFGSVFDRRFIQGRLLIHGLPPLPPTKIRDTVFIARSACNYSSNRLKHLAKILKLGNQKLDNGWPMAWFKVMQGDMAALRKMARYCEGDVLALEELYRRLLPFDQAHPRIYADRSKCGACGSDVQYRGHAWVNGLKYRRYECKGCKRWGRETKCLKEDK